LHSPIVGVGRVQEKRPSITMPDLSLRRDTLALNGMNAHGSRTALHDIERLGAMHWKIIEPGSDVFDGAAAQ
jgi:hypothetical protein